MKTELPKRGGSQILRLLILVGISVVVCLVVFHAAGTAYAPMLWGVEGKPYEAGIRVGIHLTSAKSGLAGEHWDPFGCDVHRGPPRRHHL